MNSDRAWAEVTSWGGTANGPSAWLRAMVSVHWHSGDWLGALVFAAHLEWRYGR